MRRGHWIRCTPEKCVDPLTDGFGKAVSFIGTLDIVLRHS